MGSGAWFWFLVSGFWFLVSGSLAVPSTFYPPKLQRRMAAPSTQYLPVKKIGRFHIPSYSLPNESSHNNIVNLFERNSLFRGYPPAVFIFRLAGNFLFIVI
jgi:hypothetical protein